MAAKKLTAMDFILAQLKKNKGVAYADVKAAAQKKGLVVWPIMYGRAKALLGLVPSAPRGKGKTKSLKKASAGRPNRSRTGGSKSDRVRELLGSSMTAAEIGKKVGCSVNLVYAVKANTGVKSTRSTLRPGRPRKQPTSTDSLGELVTAFRAIERERNQLRQTLDQISQAVDGAL